MPGELEPGILHSLATNLPLPMIAHFVSAVAISSTVGIAQTCINRIEAPYPSGGFNRVAVDGDRLIAGAPFVNLGDSNEGAAAIYHRNPATGVFELEAQLEPGLGSGALFGQDVDLTDDVAVVLADGSDQAFVYEWSGNAWSLSVAITSPLSNPVLWGVATNGTDVFVAADGITMVWRKQGATWLEVGQLLGGSRRTVAATPEFLATGGNIYRKDSIFGFVLEGDYSLFADYGSWSSVAFDDNETLHGYVDSAWWDYHASLSRSSLGTWGAAFSDSDSSRLTNDVDPVLAASSRGLFALGELNEPAYLQTFGVGAHNWEPTAQISSPALFRRSFQATTGTDISASGDHLALIRSGVVEIYDLSCEPVSLIDCSQSAANSTGEQGTLVAGGSTSIIDNDLTLIAGTLPMNRFGYFLASQANVVTQNPGGSLGNLCLSGNIGRFVGPGQVQNSGASGTISLTVDLNAIPSPTGFVSVMPGDTWYFQLWHRDINPTLGSNFTDSARVQFQ